jgi:hypothetical protein
LTLSLVGTVARASRAGALAGPYPGASLFVGNGTLASSPATVNMPDIGHVVFVVGTDGGIWWTTQFKPWNGLGSPPVGIIGDPAVVSWGPGRIDLFVQGGDHRLWQRWTACSGCSWSGWFKPVGDEGTLASAPAVTSWAPGRIDVVVQGTDGSTYQRDWDTDSWSGGWFNLLAPPVPATMGEHGTITTWAPGRLDVFVRGNNNRLYQNFFTNGFWQGWFQPTGTEKGTLASAPAADTWTGGVGGHNHLTVFVQGADGHLYQTTFDGAWSAWNVEGADQDVFVGSPGVPTTRQTQPYVLVRGTDNRCYQFLPATTQGTGQQAQAAAFIAQRAGFSSFTLVDTQTQTQVSGGSFTTAIRTASVIKVPIAMALVARATAQHRGLTEREQSLLHSMITQSDNDAATALWNEVGGSPAVIAMMRSLGATNTSPYPSSPNAWGFTLSTSHDLAVVLAQLASGVLGPSGTNAIITQMHQVIASQSWGIGAALPGSAVKNGWYPDPGDWRVNCLGIIGGTRYALAVMTQYPIGLGQLYGEHTCQGVAAALFPSGSVGVGAVDANAPPAASLPAITGIGMTADGG